MRDRDVDDIILPLLAPPALPPEIVDVAFDAPDARARALRHTLKAESGPRERALLALADDWSEATLEGFNDWLAGAQTEVKLYAAATEACAQKRYEFAAIALGLLADAQFRPPEVYCGLAACGLALNQMEVARLFVEASLAGPVRLPRACCLAGYCELLSGRRAAAQQHLAAAARLARRSGDFTSDMRAAQRLLLQLHFGTLST